MTDNTQQPGTSGSPEQQPWAPPAQPAEGQQLGAPAPYGAPGYDSPQPGGQPPYAQPTAPYGDSAAPYGQQPQTQPYAPAGSPFGGTPFNGTPQPGFDGQPAPYGQPAGGSVPYGAQPQYGQSQYGQPQYGGSGYGGEPPRRTGFPVWAWIVVAVGVVALVGGGILLTILLLNGNKDDGKVAAPTTSQSPAPSSGSGTNAQPVEPTETADPEPTETDDPGTGGTATGSGSLDEKSGITSKARFVAAPGSAFTNSETGVRDPSRNCIFLPLILSSYADGNPRTLTEDRLLRSDPDAKLRSVFIKTTDGESIEFLFRPSTSNKVNGMAQRVESTGGVTMLFSVSCFGDEYSSTDEVLKQIQIQK